VTSVINPEKVLVRACNLAPHREPQRPQRLHAGAVSLPVMPARFHFQVRHPDVNGALSLTRSCQLGVMFTEPAAPHCLQTKRQPTRDHD
jgi:hypothetical protein